MRVIIFKKTFIRTTWAIPILGQFSFSKKISFALYVSSPIGVKITNTFVYDACSVYRPPCNIDSTFCFSVAADIDTTRICVICDIGAPHFLWLHYESCKCNITVNVEIAHKGKTTSALSPPCGARVTHDCRRPPTTHLVRFCQ